MTANIQDLIEIKRAAFSISGISINSKEDINGVKRIQLYYGSLARSTHSPLLGDVPGSTHFPQNDSSPALKDALKAIPALESQNVQAQIVRSIGFSLVRRLREDVGHIPSLDPSQIMELENSVAEIGSPTSMARWSLAEVSTDSIRINLAKLALRVYVSAHLIEELLNNSNT